MLLYSGLLLRPSSVMKKSMAGSLGSELEVGDHVLLSREPTVERKGPTRFQSRVYPGVYVIKRKVSPSTFVIGDSADPHAVIPVRQPLHADRLVRLDMPELELSPEQPRRLELRTGPGEDWNTYVIERFGVDGRVRLMLEGGAAQTRKWVDLSEHEYRWLA